MYLSLLCTYKQFSRSSQSSVSPIRFARASTTQTAHATRQLNVLRSAGPLLDLALLVLEFAASVRPIICITNNACENNYYYATMTRSHHSNVRYYDGTQQHILAESQLQQ